MFRSPAFLGRKRLVLLGTGWANFRLLRNINPQAYKVIVVSPRNHFLFTPLLSSAAVGTLNSKSVCEPIRNFLGKIRGEYYAANAISIDKVAQEVEAQTDSGEVFKLPYDKLSIAVGYQVNTFNLPNIGQTAHFMKETGDAIRFNKAVHGILERCSYLHVLDGDLELSEAESQRLKQFLTFVVVGGGPSGVEFCAEFTDFIEKDVKKKFPHLARFISVHLISNDLLGMFSTDLQNYAGQHLKIFQKVNLHLSVGVTNNEPLGPNEYVDNHPAGRLTLSDGTHLDYGLLVWCAGIKPTPLVAKLDVSKTPNGAQLLTNRQFNVMDEENIFALGDCKTIQGYRLPQTAQVANQEAEYLANRLNQEATGKAYTKDFTYQDFGILTFLGTGTAIMQTGNTKVRGTAGFVAWRLIYWVKQLSNRGRFMLMTDWFKTYIFGRDFSRDGKSSPSS